MHTMQIFIKQITAHTLGRDSRSNNVTGEPEIPFVETKLYVSQSYSAGPSPERASIASSGHISVLNIVVIIFFVTLAIGLVIVGS